METQREALITALSKIIEIDVGSRKVAQCADVVIAVCDSFPRTATLLNGGTVLVSGRTSMAHDFKAAVNLPDGQMIVTGGIDMAKPGADQQAELNLEPPAPELPFPANTPGGIGGIFKKIFS